MKLNYVPALRFKALTRFYDPIVRLTTREPTVKATLLANTCVAEGSTVIDLGCGTGTLAIDIKKHHPGARVIGLDADPAVLDLARLKARAERVEIEFVEGFASALPFPDGLADRVVSSLFFHHLQTADKQAALREAMRVLKCDGELHIVDWDVASNVLMRALFVPVRILDGFSNTRDHVIGRLPAMIQEAGGRCVIRRQRFNTVLGTLSIFQATK